MYIVCESLHSIYQSSQNLVTRSYKRNTPKTDTQNPTPKRGKEKETTPETVITTYIRKTTANDTSSSLLAYYSKVVI